MIIFGRLYNLILNADKHIPNHSELYKIEQRRNLRKQNDNALIKVTDN